MAKKKTTKKRAVRNAYAPFAEEIVDKVIKDKIVATIQDAGEIKSKRHLWLTFCSDWYPVSENAFNEWLHLAGIRLSTGVSISMEATGVPASEAETVQTMPVAGEAFDNERPGDVAAVAGLDTRHGGIVR